MVSGYLTSTNSPRVDGLSTNPRDLGCHNLQLTSFKNPEVPIVLLEEVGIPLICKLWIPY